MAQIQLDDSLLAELGLDKYGDDDREVLLSSVMQNLEMRMGIRVAEIVGEEKLVELNELTDAGKDAEAQQWIRDNVPNYEQVAAEELDRFKQEVKDMTHSVLRDNI